MSTVKPGWAVNATTSGQDVVASKIQLVAHAQKEEEARAVSAGV